MGRAGAARAVTATNCLFVDNIATNGNGYGGALYEGSAESCRFIGNIGTYGGGAFWTSPLVNCLIISNYANRASAVHGSAVLLNCTVVANMNTASGGGAAFSDPVYATNCIVWANVQLSDGATNNWVPSKPNYRFVHSCLSPLPTGDQDGGGNIDANPRFVDAENDNYQLRASSPCVNTGMNMDWMVGAVDLDGQPRIFPADGTVDMGAFERIPSNTYTILLVR